MKGGHAKKRIIFIGLGLLIFCMIFYTIGDMAKAAFYENPSVSFSPDRKAWTVHEAIPNGEGDNIVNPSYWYPYGETIVVGKENGMVTPGKGEHLYQYERHGIVPIQKWIVVHRAGRCIHNDTIHFHDLPLVASNCKKSYYSGWNAYCADCGEKVFDFNIYMSREKVRKITEVDTDLDYYYLCPSCGHLEQGRSVRHMCMTVSANRYRVQYMPNGSNVAGFMQSSYHMYGNVELFEGEKVSPQKKLNLNSYSKKGYLFAGWNTKPDGSGRSFTDGQEILNLSEENYDEKTEAGIVRLYAQWVKAAGKLEVDPNGGAYSGNKGISTFSVGYGESFTLHSSYVTPPEGFLVSFDVCGGTRLDGIRDVKVLDGWTLRTPSKGTLEGKKYIFYGKNGEKDRVTAIYHSKGICLPMPQKAGASFGGWYYDKALTKLAGKAGDLFIPQKNVTLYAQWVDLVLNAKANYKVYEGKGAIDLSWQQADGNLKTYLVYQRKEGEDFQKINSIAAEEQDGTHLEYSGAGNSEVFSVVSSGFYRLVAKGEQGKDYGQFKGGLGGSVEGVFFLTAGDELEICVGKNADKAGGMGNGFGEGGKRSTIRSKKLGVLLVAGGGGGASSAGNGGDGGAEDGLREDGAAEGENGAAGGGAGWIGGKSGIFEQHVHTQACVHVHRGNPETGGECYKETEITETCRVVITGPYVDWGKSDNCDDCIKAGRNGYGSMHPWAWRKEHLDCGEATDFGIAGWWKCEVCQRVGYQWGSGVDRPNVSNHLWPRKTYVLNCNKKYDCGDPPGRMVTSCGGSNYVNAKAATSYSMMRGEHSGEAFASVEVVHAGFQEKNKLTGVNSPDLNCPDSIALESISVEVIGKDLAKVTFERPDDQGTYYYHQVHSYLQGKDQVLSRSNITRTEIVSGIRGYYYSIDDRKDTVLKQKNIGKTMTFLGREELQVTILTEKKYLHLAAVDKAGNLGGTTSIELSAKELELAWEPCTDMMTINSVLSGTDYGSVAKSGQEGVFYVRANGRTPFLLGFSAYLSGAVRENYQIDRMTFDYTLDQGDANGYYTALLPLGSLSKKEIIYAGGSLGRQAGGYGLLQAAMFGEAGRLNYGKKVLISQGFCMGEELDGKKVKVIPVAGASLNGKVYLSDRQDDETHGIYLIGDGKAPQIIGMEKAEEILLSDRQKDVKIELKAKDEGSGVAEFMAILHNLDSGAEAAFYPEKDGRILIKLKADHPLYVGSLRLEVRATDRVGNSDTKSCGAEDLGLLAEVIRVLEPHDPIFKKGESGILKIWARGYVDRIEVEFPGEFTAVDDSLNQVFEYKVPKDFVAEEIRFMVPLSLNEDKDYVIKVKAYKNSDSLQEQPKFCTIWVGGTVLDEIRTRLL